MLLFTSLCHSYVRLKYLGLGQEFIPKIWLNCLNYKGLCKFALLNLINVVKIRLSVWT